MESRKFKKSFIGGFDKEDVINYIEEIQKQAGVNNSGQENAEEIERLREENRQLREALEKSNEQLKLLADPIHSSNKILASSIAYSQSHYNSITELVNGLCRTTNESALRTKENVENIISFSKASRDELKKSYDQFGENLNQLKNNLEETMNCFEKISEYSLETAEKTKVADADISQVIETAQKLLSDIENRQDENNIALEEKK